MIWILRFCCICQATGTIVSLLEILKSEYDSTNTNVYFSSQGSFPSAVLLDDEVQFLCACYWLKYAGAVCLTVGFIVLRDLYCKTKLRSVEDVWSPSAWFMVPQLIGVITLFVRLVAQFLYLLRHKCDTDTTNERSLEPHYTMLGISASSGLLSAIVFVVYVFSFMYNRGVEYEKNIEKQRTKQTFINM